MNAIELLDDFRRQRSDEAFGELVRRYTNLVYSAAKRRLGSEMLAQDAARAVFIRLAKNPPSLSREAELTGWLHRTTLHVSIDLWRSEARRRAREEHAVAMQPILDEDRSWADIRPCLDEALDELDDSDREIILLRFFNHKSMRELGDALGISDDAAKMRVSRAVARLRDQLGAAGVTCSAAGVGAFLAERAVEAAPAGVAAAIAAVTYPIAQASVSLVTGAASASIGFPLAKVAAALAGIGLIGLTVWLVQRRQPPAPSPHLCRGRDHQRRDGTSSCRRRRFCRRSEPGRQGIVKSTGPGEAAGGGGSCPAAPNLGHHGVSDRHVRRDLSDNQSPSRQCRI
jgi:RNA polymerase sigma factor (sigma-70 family)